MWADALIIQYEDGRKELNKMKEKLGESELDLQDKKLINGMIRDMTYALEWMKKGRRPGNLRGIDRRSVYQRTALVDMELMPSLDIIPQPRELNEEDKNNLYNVLIKLSHRERQCYLLHMGKGWSMREIANELSISKASVQTFIDRAKKKITEHCHTTVI